MTKAPTFNGVSRRRLLRQAVATGAGLGALSAGVPGRFQFMTWAAADDKPPIGTWPAGSEGGTVNVAAAVPLTGTYAVQGEDELKGWQLAVEHINNGDPLLQKIAPKVTKGLLGKQVNLLHADSAAKPNDAVQAVQKFIADNKVVLMTGSTSSAVAVALNHFAQREHVLYVTGISGSNDTTGKDCVRYGFRQNFYGETAANAIGPVLLKAFGKDKKAAFMTPDYTYGHTVTKSVNDYLAKNGGWTMVTNQISPLGTQDFSQYLTNIANSGAEYLINVNWGRDAVLSIQQAKQFGVIPKMALSFRIKSPSSPRKWARNSPQVSTPQPTFGGHSKTSIPWPRCSSTPSKRSTTIGRSGRQQRLHVVRYLGAHGLKRRARSTRRM